MKNRFTLVASLIIFAVFAASARAAPTDDVYRLGPDSEPHEGVPQGKIVGPLTLASNVYPETTRHYWIYVPAQYDPARPVPLMIWGIGTHSNKQGGAIMPDMLRWLWRDYPCPDDPNDASNRGLFVP